MTATNGWPGKPGVPRDPGLPGAHWLKGYTENAWMYDGDGGWWGPGYSHKLDAETVAVKYSYLGPVLTHDEATALQARADRNAAGFARVDAEAERAKFLHKQEIEALQKRVAELEEATKKAKWIQQYEVKEFQARATKLTRLVEILLENDPNDMAADAVTVFDVWQKEARELLARHARLNARQVGMEKMRENESAEIRAAIRAALTGGKDE
jgi:hypothetical protein